ncbi:MAG: glycosyltransferase [Actinomycetota bacterium]|nr:glycosyltransferase [Actinomycetota bacterium]
MADSKDSKYKKIKVSMLGIRGIPPRYGGLETCADELCKRLCPDYIEAVVFCRKHNIRDKNLKEYHGASLVHLPSINTKTLDTITHSFLSILYIMLHKTSRIIHIYGVGSFILFPLLFFYKKKVIVSADGADWERKKWNRIIKFLLKKGASFAVKFADIVVVDSPVVENLYKKEFPDYIEKIKYIPYGANIEEIDEDERVLKKYGIEKDRYILFVGRLSPEKGVHYLIDAFIGIKTNLNLVIVGDSEYHKEYIKELKNKSDSRVIFTGYIYGEEFKKIVRSCLFYIQPSELEGTSPMILTAMGYGKCVIVNGIPENISTIGDAGIYFEKNNVEDLRAKMELLLSNKSLIKSYGNKALKRIKENYSWDVVANEYLKLYKELYRKLEFKD